ncbi:hypothetical protein Vafri_20809 [Volvox africanus]|uniref:BTB domain-containing protein n=1 Tax=Volvox africanus TaxID=51714 RepID=A0A8J4FAR8_9CHLO|nr:hypothetical protein Vafri_20809 [Volvox africanus]
MVTVRLSDEGVRSILTRVTDLGETQVLILTGLSLRPLLGLSALDSGDEEAIAGLKLGPPLELRERRSSDGKVIPFTLPEDEEFWRAAYDAATGLVYIGAKSLIWQLDLSANGNIMTLLVGEGGEEETVDGPGAIARVDRPFCIVADGCGSLLIKDCGSNRVRRVVLPAVDSPSGSMSPLVITLGPEYAANLWAVALEFSNPPRMYVATKTAIYRHDALPYSTTPPTSAECADLASALETADGNPLAGDPSLVPPLLAGREGDNSRSDGLVSGLREAAPAGASAASAVGPATASAAAASFVSGRRSHGSAASAAPGEGPGGRNSAADAARAGGGGVSSARFSLITYMLLDSLGRLIVVERDPHDVEPYLRMVWPCGLVTTLATDFALSGSEFGLALLPGGWLAVHAWSGSKMQLVRLEPGLQPSLPATAPGTGCSGALANGGAFGAAAAAGLPGLPGLDGLAADLGALLDGGCSGSGEVGKSAVGADVEVVVGDRSFSCHRAILGARCEYFRRLFQSGFADSSRSEVRRTKGEDVGGRGVCERGGGERERGRGGNYLNSFSVEGRPGGRTGQMARPTQPASLGVMRDGDVSPTARPPRPLFLAGGTPTPPPGSLPLLPIPPFR